MRLAHVRQRHKELQGADEFIAATLTGPDVVVLSDLDPDVRIYERRFVRKMGSTRRVSPDGLLYGPPEERSSDLAVRTGKEQVNIWLDPEGDFLEVLFDDRIGYFKETADDRVMVRVDMEGNIIGFNVLGVSSMKQPLSLSLEPTPNGESQ
jgi:uncharacterized protein YuzE